MYDANVRLHELLQRIFTNLLTFYANQLPCINTGRIESENARALEVFTNKLNARSAGLRTNISIGVSTSAI